MSFQLQQPAPAKGSRRRGLLGLGIVVLLGGVGTGAALFVTSGSQYEDAVKNLQRAPVGCDTEFDFTGTGTFVFYAESKGSVGDLRGDCDNADAAYDHGDDDIDVDLTLVDEDGDEVDLDRAEGASYDKGGFVGSEIRTLTLDEPGTYTLSVASDDTDFAIAVGRNPKDDADSVQTIAIVVAVIGLVLGGALILLGMRRKPAPPTPGAWNPAGNGPQMGSFQPGAYQPGGYPPVAGPPISAPPVGPPDWQPSGPPPAPVSQPSWQPAPPQSPPAPPSAPGSPWGSPQQ